MISPEEHDAGAHWTLIGGGPDEHQNALAEIICAALNAGPDGVKAGDAERFLSFCARHFHLCRRDVITDAELLSLVEYHPVLRELTHPKTPVTGAGE